MSRRVRLPGASELFRPTDNEDEQPTPALVTGPDPAPPGSGRIRHDEKITVYVSADELLALEQARLTLRARHGTAVDRGRIVREAIAAALADFDVRADESELVRRLSQS
jgi:hypothetical protein